MNSFFVVAVAILALANAAPSGVLLGAGILAPRHNQWGDVGPSGIVTGAGSQSAAGIVTGAGAAGPSGIVTGHGAIGPNGVPSSVRDDGIVDLGPRAIAPIVAVAPARVAVAPIAVAPARIATVGLGPVGLGIGGLGLGAGALGLGVGGLRGDAIIGPSASSVVVGSSLGLGGQGW